MPKTTKTSSNSNAKATVVSKKGYISKSLSDCWGTPDAILEKHKGWYDPTPWPTPIWDGLKTNWLEKGQIFCNPPYSNIGPFAQKCKETVLEAKKRNISIEIHFLIPSRTDTRYFHDHIHGFAKLDFIKGRLKFKDLTGVSRKPQAAPFPSVMCIYKHVAAPTPVALNKTQIQLNENIQNAMKQLQLAKERAESYVIAQQKLQELSNRVYPCYS